MVAVVAVSAAAIAATAVEATAVAVTAAAAAAAAVAAVAVHLGGFNGGVCGARGDVVALGVEFEVVDERLHRRLWSGQELV